MSLLWVWGWGGSGGEQPRAMQLERRSIIVVTATRNPVLC